MAGRGLNDDEVAAEMRKMIEFIRQEAQEKAREIQVKADEEHNIEKAKLVRQETIAIEAAYEKKIKQAQVQKKIAYSNHVNKARLRLLQMREEQLDDLFKQAKQRLSVLTQDQGKYSELLKKLLMQGLLQMMEKDVVLVVKQKDVSLVEPMLSDAKKTFEQKSGFPIKLEISKGYLPETTTGGIVLMTSNGRISINNSLEARLELSGEALLPAIRVMLFGPSPTRRFFD